MKEKKYPNVIQCLRCRTVLVSNYRHDFQQCPCKNNAFIDGGYDYLRYGAADMKQIQILKLSKKK